MGQHFFVSDGSNYENSKIRFPYFASYFRGNAMEIRECFSIITAKKFVGSSSHIYKVWLALRTLFINKLVNGFVFGGVLKIAFHYVKQSFA